jgi:D-serine deaminase-like pyridoxal phosphate-dependent protein
MFLPLGTPKDQLDTPALLLDLDLFEANVKQAAETCRNHGVHWRPHAKCHKSPDIGHRLIEAGAIGLTCAKLGEAEVFAAAGIPDLLIANYVVGPQKVARLIEVRQKADPIVTIDHIDQAIPISAAMAAKRLKVRAILEIDIGMDRAGVAPGKPAVELAKKVAALPGIEFVGVMGYEGHLLLVDDPSEKASRICVSLNQLTDTVKRLEAAGLHCSIVSCGGTGSLPFSVGHPGITELQAGGVIFMDAFYRYQCKLEGYRHALTLLVTVVGRPTAERAIIDAGRKTMNMEIAMPLVMGREGITVDRLSAEHGMLKVGPTAQDLKIGDRLEIIPGYSDLTTTLHNQFFVVQGDKLVDIWPLTARGKLA